MLGAVSYRHAPRTSARRPNTSTTCVWCWIKARATNAAAIPMAGCGWEGKLLAPRGWRSWCCRGACSPQGRRAVQTLAPSASTPPTSASSWTRSITSAPVLRGGYLVNRVCLAWTPRLLLPRSAVCTISVATDKAPRMSALLLVHRSRSTTRVVVFCNFLIYVCVFYNLSMSLYVYIYMYIYIHILFYHTNTKTSALTYILAQMCKHHLNPPG